MRVDTLGLFSMSVRETSDLKTIHNPELKDEIILIIDEIEPQLFQNGVTILKNELIYMTFQIYIRDLFKK